VRSNPRDGPGTCEGTDSESHRAGGGSLAQAMECARYLLPD
jgi:hypothetical protein